MSTYAEITYLLTFVLTCRFFKRSRSDFHDYERRPKSALKLPAGNGTNIPGALKQGGIFVEDDDFPFPVEWDMLHSPKLK